ncbi:MAG: ABC transporter substrate-binding protein [Sporichthyaceae bacterium]
MSPWTASRSAKLVAAAAAASLLAGCAASTEVQQAVEARQAAEAARPGALPLAAAPAAATAVDVGPEAIAAGEAPAAAAAPAAETGGAAPAPGRAPDRPAAKAKKGAAPAGAPAATTAKQPAAAAATGCAAAAPAGGNGGATDTGVTDGVIKIGGTFFNGGYLDKYGKVSENAPRAYFNFVNDSGGICGRKIQYVTCDTAGTADGTSGCLTKLADQDKVFLMGPSLDFNLDIVGPSLAKRKLPWVGSSGLYTEEFESPWMFPTQPPGVAVGALISQYAATQLKAKKVGVSLLDDVAGPSCTAKAAEVAKANGSQVIKTAANRQIETSLDSQVATLKNAGVEAVLFCNDPVNTVKFIQAAQRVGWKPTFVGGFVLADDVPQAAGNNGKGMYGFTFFDFYGANTPGVKRYRQITEFYFPNTFHHFYEQASYVGAVAIVEALRKTGPKLTREAFLKELRSMTDFDSGLGLRLNFGDLKASKPTGLMLRADDSLAWQPVTSRFAIKGAASGDAVPGTVARPAAAAARSARRGRRE